MSHALSLLWCKRLGPSRCYTLWVARMPDLGGITGGQDRFEERWAQQVAPKLAEVEAAGRIAEEAARRRLAEAAQRAAQERVEAAARRLAQHFDPVELRLQDAKNLAASLCEPPPTQAEKVRPRAAACTPRVTGLG